MQNTALQPLFSLARINFRKHSAETRCVQKGNQSLLDSSSYQTPSDPGGREQPETLQKGAVVIGEPGEPTTAHTVLLNGLQYKVYQKHNKVVHGEGNKQPLKNLQHPCTIWEPELMLMSLSFKTHRHQKHKKLSYSYLKRKQKIPVTFYWQRKAQATLWLKYIGNNTEPLSDLLYYSDLEETLILVLFCIYKELKSAFMFSLQQLEAVKQELQPQHEIPCSQETPKA